MPTFTFPALPPSSNHSYMGARGRLLKTDELRAWERGAALLTGGWQPPERTPLLVSVVLVLSKARMHKLDLDGCLKALIDATVGRRCDQWVVSLEAHKLPSPSNEERAVVTVEAMAPQGEKALGEAG